jgi:protoheme IX farnesyltransferase
MLAEESMPAGLTERPATREFSTKERVLGFVALTKPRIIELLLVTTVPTMIVAERGMPSLWLMQRP